MKYSQTYTTNLQRFRISRFHRSLETATSEEQARAEVLVKPELDVLRNFLCPRPEHSYCAQQGFGLLKTFNPTYVLIKQRMKKTSFGKYSKKTYKEYAKNENPGGAAPPRPPAGGAAYFSRGSAPRVPL